MPRRAVQPPLSERQAAVGGVAAVDRALSLLDVFTTQSPVLSLSELAERTHQYKSTVLRLLASLENSHVVRRHDDGRFGLGPGIARLNAVYATSFRLADAVTPTLNELVVRTGESAAFHVRLGDKDLCLKRVDSPHAVRDHTRAGDLRPLSGNVSGHVLQAFSGGRGGLFARVRREQVLVADGDIVPELAGIAAPVFGPGGELTGVVALTMPSTRLQAGHAAEVRRAAQSITTDLGGAYPLAAQAGPKRAGPKSGTRGAPQLSG